jgi:hypothetical protein
MAGMQAAPPDWGVGQHVQAYWHEGDQGAGYYPGKIVQKYPDGTVDIEWDDSSSGIKNRIPVAHLKRRPPDWGVGQHVQAYWHEGDQGAGYYPGKIMQKYPDGTVDIQWDWDDHARWSPHRIAVDHLKRRRGRPASSNKSSLDHINTASVINMPFGNKQQAFRRLAQLRTEKALKYIRLIQNLSDRRNYQYSAGEVTKIFTTLGEALDSAEKKFSDGVQRTAFQL